MTRLRNLLLGVLVAGCLAPTGQPTTAPATQPGGAPVGSPTDGAPVPASPPSPTADSPTADPAASPTSPAEPTDRQPLPPPTARLLLPDGSSVPATVGSYAYDGAFLDAPWLPAHSLPVASLPPATMLRLDLDPSESFVRWSARYAGAADESGDVITQLQSGGDGVTPLEHAELPPLPAGAWVLMVQLYFADEAGDAAYYWHVEVP